MLEGPGEEGADIIELFPKPETVDYDEADLACLSDEERKILTMRGVLGQPRPEDLLPINNPLKSRRVEGEGVVTSLRAIEQRALKALSGRKD